ncbi:DUF4446 family protein [Schaedlerella arabinosiphila]|jgi:hypothetical protein|uniref:DUF4446 family protein n=1 Tax=Schaedlerella arabinosiphila TaxID=2044587 RepID=N1ZZC0_9FIRM|nr:DUF4446 family protein [Schaedlerella arabinosiphila]KAI4441450.1 hypothetical protein C824_003958 [Schaedlerella arabinosiphila]NDO72067.1 DUF4446 family protein [Schaedlerella arabinosiphila]RRK34086.1 DUF4446 family protein [Schaedlerella arabinosiphila]
MVSAFISKIGIQTDELIALLFLIQIFLFVLLISVNMKYKRLKRNYSMFMRGKDGKNLEESILDKFAELDKISRVTRKNEEQIRKMNKRIRKNYQKVGIIRYNAFQEMGGNLSFALTMLDEEDSGWVLNAMHSRDACYTYIKEIVKGESYIELAEEEKESLERAIFQEAYDFKDMDLKKLR